MAYLTYFKCELMIKLQYKVAALAGLATQFFWGLMYALIYTAFYSFTNIDNISINELMSYVWLNQAFLLLIYFNIDKGMVRDIQDGTVSYELCRPYDLYLWWFVKIFARKIAACALRFLPVILFALILPQPYNLSLPNSFLAFILFILSLLLAGVLVTTIELFVVGITFFTYQARGVSSLFKEILSMFSGFTIPLPLLPVFLLTALEYLPFRFIGDLPFRVYSGNINVSYGLFSIGMQLIWIIAFVILGRLLLRYALKRVSIQGG